MFCLICAVSRQTPDLDMPMRMVYASGSKVLLLNRLDSKYCEFNKRDLLRRKNGVPSWRSLSGTVIALGGYASDRFAVLTKNPAGKLVYQVIGSQVKKFDIPTSLTSKVQKMVPEYVGHNRDGRPTVIFRPSSDSGAFLTLDWSSNGWHISSRNPARDSSLFGNMSIDQHQIPSSDGTLGEIRLHFHGRAIRCRIASSTIKHCFPICSFLSSCSPIEAAGAIPTENASDYVVVVKKDHSIEILTSPLRQIDGLSAAVLDDKHILTNDLQVLDLKVLWRSWLLRHQNKESKRGS